jgi:hypothetical protein
MYLVFLIPIRALIVFLAVCFDCVQLALFLCLALVPFLRLVIQFLCPYAKHVHMW